MKTAILATLMCSSAGAASGPHPDKVRAGVRAVQEAIASAQENGDISRELQAAMDPAAAVAMMKPCLSKFPGVFEYMSCFMTIVEVDAEGNVDNAKSQEQCTQMTTTWSAEQEVMANQTTASKAQCDSILGDNPVGNMMLCTSLIDAKGSIAFNVAMNASFAGVAGCEMLANQQQDSSTTEACDAESLNALETGMDELIKECNALDGVTIRAAPLPPGAAPVVSAAARFGAQQAAVVGGLLLATVTLLA